MPAPTPSPSPTPTATPTPAATYDLAFDFSRDRSFQPNGAQLTAIGTQTNAGNTYASISAKLYEPSDVPFFTFASSTKQAGVSVGNLAGQTYPGSQITLQQSDRTTYQSPTGFLAIGQLGPQLGGLPAHLRYSFVLNQYESSFRPSGGFDVLERRMVAGASTAASDVPRSGTATFQAVLLAEGVSATGEDGYAASHATLSLDFVTRTITGTITATSTSGSASSIVLTVTGQLSATGNRLAGSVTTADGGTGTFNGELYGPQGAEIGLAFALARNSQQVIGTFGGSLR
ncbi:transferrin-binding protein-like solute binding protein [Sphingomonas sp. BK580]|uniref:transferrin-binding protein-like solute binding protein n=1 Tax=Sphingomonas sp. BK580 TaxID=2586972 RepID=UPI00161F7DF4|nr:transferrin-binding protein-like solute binding protein [Sphingomonas sp. BK580]MBB3692058.1 hypothetical protein [Sphingomonas sp. BK580]